MERLISRRWSIGPLKRYLQRLARIHSAQTAESPGEQSTAFFVEPGQLDQVFDCEVGERLDAIFVDATDSDHSVLGLHFNRDVANLRLHRGPTGVMV
ncbi:hypothetical protein [Bradyrhizobium tunisiense]|uniref:hypothetical protein n=1 Tax=Bradyrhizobium tunisiense TaxID=3278709 RepID=UPI0035DE1B70